MGLFSRFENRMEDAVDSAANKMFDAPISPVQIAKKAEKQMKREKMVGAGKQYAPTLYTVLVNPEDDERLFGYYPTLAGETETYLAAKAADEGLTTDGQPLVRFIVDEGLRHGKFDVVAEIVAAPIVEQLRQEEFMRYGIPAPKPQNYSQAAPYAPQAQNFAPMPAPAQMNAAQPVPQIVAQAMPQQVLPQQAMPQQVLPQFAAQPMPQQAMPQAAEQAMSQIPAQAMQQQAMPQFSAQPMPQQAMPQQAMQAEPQTSVFQQNPAEIIPQANPALQAQLVDITNNQLYVLSGNGTSLTLGRESTNNIVVNDLNASRVHAELRQEPQGFWSLTDLGSTNGTFVNTQEIGACALNNGDTITIGLTNFVFRLQ